MNKETPKTTDSVLPNGFKTVIGTLLLIISIGLMSLWGIIA